MDSSIMIINDNVNLKDKLKLNATTLKIIGVILMFIDHIYEMFMPMGLVPSWLDAFGRPVFPIFLFLAADSFYYTNNKKNYMKRLFTASVIMTLLTTITQRLVPSEYNMSLMNNAFSTFFISTIYMLSWDNLKEAIKKKNKKQLIKSIGLALIPIITTIPLIILSIVSSKANPVVLQILALLSIIFPSILTIEGGALYVLLGLLFYIFRENRVVQSITMIIFTIICQLMVGGIQWTMIFTLLAINLYNGEKGRGMKYFFYIFYPVHIIGLYLIANLVF